MRALYTTYHIIRLYLKLNTELIRKQKSTCLEQKNIFEIIFESILNTFIHLFKYFTIDCSKTLYHIIKAKVCKTVIIYIIRIPFTQKNKKKKKLK